MSNKLEVGERRSLASHYTLTTVCSMCTMFSLKSSRLLSHLLMSFLLYSTIAGVTETDY